MKIKPEVIAYKNPVERLLIKTKEERKGNKVEYDDKFIYSYPNPNQKKPVKFERYVDSGASRSFRNFKCKSCMVKFKLVSLRDIQWVMCPSCGSLELEDMRSRDARLFERLIK